RGENMLRDLRIRNVGGGATVGIRVTVNDVEMTQTETYLGRDATTTVPIGVYGGDPDVMIYTVTVTTPEKPLHPVTDERRVRVD
ncbi:MAG: DEAD/DEAH box helicase, partial [Salinarchaeum sp.]